MRLLLLLSALLSTLSGVVGTRAQAQPVVAASIAEPIGARAGGLLAARIASPRHLAAVPALLSVAALPAAPSLVSTVVRRRLFAERRRE